MTPRPGVGLTLQSELRPFLDARPNAVDYIELVPDTSWVDLGRGATPRYVDDDETVEWLAAHAWPVVLHSIGLSIGSAHRFDLDHVAQIARWQQRLGAAWHSDHLAWHLASTPAGEVNVNLTMPVSLDREMLDLIAARVHVVQEAIDAPFLLENNVYYFDGGTDEMDEPSFLNELARRTGCGLLLDLHNLWVNVSNRGWDPEHYFDTLDLDRVIEIHVAGGTEMDGFLLDAHSGAAPESVWNLLAIAGPQCSNLRGVTFELFGSWFDTMGDDVLEAELERARGAIGAATPV